MGAKVVAIGDPGQLASVQAGGWLRAVGRELGALRLTEVMRQRDPAERRALAALHDRNPTATWTGRRRRGGSRPSSDRTGAREHAVAEWAGAAREVGVDAGGDDRPRQRDPRDALNQAARELRRDQGELGEERVYGRMRRSRSVTG